MADLIFHSMAESAYLWTVMHAADEKRVPYELKTLAYLSPEHLALHPFGKMPVMQHEDFYLYESIAIAHYIDRAFDGPALQPSSPRAQAHMLRWISVVNSYVFPIMNRFMKERLVRTLWGAEPDHAFIASAREPLMLQMRLINEALSATPFVVGDALTLADSFLLPQVLFFGRTPEGAAMLARAPGAAAWLARLLARDSYIGGHMSRAYEAFQQIPTPKDLAWPVD